MKSFSIFDFRLPICGFSAYASQLRQGFAGQEATADKATASNCRAGTVVNLPAAAGREARLSERKQRPSGVATFSTVPALQTSNDLEGTNS
ncbi:MAG: hypothetical protein DRP64_20775 [Verrucomicrobia bacterium]|nr:MAG: hypothetical protein DRP64_20775 [Verrucomicrobiota bacterium]